MRPLIFAAILVAAGQAHAAAPDAPKPGPRLALNVVLGDNIDAARGHMAMEKIRLKREDQSGTVVFFERCASPFRDAKPCAVITDRGMVKGLRGSIGPLSAAAARKRFLRAKADVEAERGGPAAPGTKGARDLERLEWRQDAGEKAKVVTSLWLVRLAKGDEVRFSYVLEIGP